MFTSSLSTFFMPISTEAWKCDFFVSQCKRYKSRYRTSTGESNRSMCDLVANKKLRDFTPTCKLPLRVWWEYSYQAKMSHFRKWFKWNGSSWPYESTLTILATVVYRWAWNRAIFCSLLGLGVGVTFRNVGLPNEDVGKRNSRSGASFRCIREGVSTRFIS